MFKKKGSSTNVAIVCSLICAALGVYYGLNSMNAIPVAPPAAGDVFTAGVFSNHVVPAVEVATAVESMADFSPHRTSTGPDPKRRKLVKVSRTTSGTAFFARPAVRAEHFATPVGPDAGTASFAAPAVDTPAGSSSHAGTAAAAVSF